MKYVQIAWIHDHPSEPTLIYGELDCELWERRKVEVFRDGQMGFADDNVEMGGTQLGLEPCPDLELIDLDPEFEVKEITKDEFERIWKAARDGAS